MFRDDKEAMVHRVDSLSREADHLRVENDRMREELMAIQRGAASAQPGYNLYSVDPSYLTAGQRAAFSHHQLTAFPVWAVGLLHVLTFGLFPLIHFGLQHDKLPQLQANDPSAGKAIGFHFIPYFNFYWIFFNSMRLADRLNLQFKLRGAEPTAPKGLMVAASVMSVIPYLGWFLLGPIMWTVGACVMQSAINRLVALGAVADPAAPTAALDPFAEPPAGLLPE